MKFSLLFKALAVLATFAAMPITIKYLGNEAFGVWATMLTLTTWIVMFDFGIGNGLKNKVAEYLAKNDTEMARTYISTAYIVIGAVSIFLTLLIFIIHDYINWEKVFNTRSIDNNLLSISVLLLGAFILINFLVSLVVQVYHGLQKSSMPVFGQFITNFIALVSVIILSEYFMPSLLYLVIAYGISLISSNIILTSILYSQHHELFPTVVKLKFDNVSSLFTLGMQFFVIQIAVIVVFMSDKLIITQLLGPSLVTPYEVIFKLFSILTIIHTIILVPLWPAYSDAFHRGDMKWIRNSIVKQIKIFLIISVLALGLAYIGSDIVRVWIGQDFAIELKLYLLMAVFIIVSTWSNVFAYFVNSINSLKVQLVTAVTAAIINIPLTIYFSGTLNMGLNGILIGTIISLSLFAILGPIQVYYLVREKCE